jgi:hypothetical protein
MERTATNKTRKTRFVFKPWVEKTLTGILVFNLMMILGISDVASIGVGLIVYGILFGSSFIILRLLQKYGKEYNSLND